MGVENDHEGEKTFIFVPGDSITWKDEETAKTFNAQAFGHGQGPFKILRVRDALSLDEVIITFENAKGVKVKMNSSYFKKVA